MYRLIHGWRGGTGYSKSCLLYCMHKDDLQPELLPITLYRTFVQQCKMNCENCLVFFLENMSIDLVNSICTACPGNCECCPSRVHILLTKPFILWFPGLQRYLHDLHYLSLLIFFTMLFLSLLLQMSSSTKTNRLFVSEPMEGKPVTAVPGIGNVLGRRLKDKDYYQAKD